MSKPKPRPKRRSTHHFSALVGNKLPTQYFTNPAVAGSAAQKTNTCDFVNFLDGISNFHTMTRDDLVEHLYTTEPEIATATDSFALMVRNAFQFFTIVNYNEIDHVPDKIEIDGNVFDFTKGKALAKEMVDVANAISKEQDIKSLYEQYAAILKLHGTLFILINDNGSLTQLPNDHVTIIDHMDRIQGAGSYGNTEYADLITEANYLVLDENLDTQKVYPRGKFMIIKYHDTPIYIEDRYGRITYGIYGVSPLRRAIIPTWYRRILMSADATWRYRAFPKPHHKIDAASFNTSNFTGTPRSKLEQAQAAAQAAINAHAAAMSEVAPDQPIVTLSTTDVKMVEPSSATHLDVNGAIEQTTNSIFSAIGMPRSIVQGLSSSNYAGELVIYSHANDKINQIAEKISRAILLAMKRKLLVMNKEYPVDLLDVSISYDMSSNPLENAKIAQLMVSMGRFTDDEIRDMMKYKPLTDEQKEELEKRREVENESKLPNNGGQLGATSNGKIIYPTTPESSNQQPTDGAQSKINDALGYES